MSVAEVLFDSMHVGSPSPRFCPAPLLKYLAAVQADREKELKAVQEAEVRPQARSCWKREAALERQKKEEEEKLRKQLDEQVVLLI
jgi:hypothetical protein